MDTAKGYSKGGSQQMNHNEDGQISALVGYVLGNVQKEVSGEMLLADDESTVIPGSPTNPASKKKSKFSKAKQLLCLERNVSHDDIKAMTQTGVENYVLQQTRQDKENYGENEVGSDNGVEDVCSVVHTEVLPSIVSPGKEEMEFNHQVRLYVHNIIASALEIVSAGEMDCRLMTDSDHTILLRSFHDFSAEFAEAAQFVIPAICIEKVEDECLSDDDSMEDGEIDDVVKAVFTNVADRDDDITCTVASDDKCLRKLSYNSDILDNIKPSRGTIKITDDSQPSPRKYVKRIFGFKKHVYKLNQHSGERSGPHAAHEPLLQHQQQLAADSVQLKQGEFEATNPSENVNKDMTHRDADLPPKRTKVFSRRIFNRLFGNKQSYSPAKIQSKGPNTDGETDAF